MNILDRTKQNYEEKEAALAIKHTNMLSIQRDCTPISLSMQSNNQNNTITKTIASGDIEKSQTNIKSFRFDTTNYTNTTLTPVATAQITPKSSTLLINLTDNMVLVEAPSFVVPYVYEKDPIKPLKEFVKKIEKKLKDTKGDVNINQSEEKNVFYYEKNMNNYKHKSTKKLNANENKNITKEISEYEKERSSKNKGNYVSDIDIKNYSKSKSVSKSNVYLKQCDEVINHTSNFDIENNPKETQNPNYPITPKSFQNICMQLGMNLVEKHSHLELLRFQKNKINHNSNEYLEEIQTNMNSFTKKNYEPLKLSLKKCVFCNFKTESSLVMAHHLESPHMMNNKYYMCNFCTLQVRKSKEILQHMNTHNIKGRVENISVLNQCPNCPFENRSKNELTKHLNFCSKNFCSTNIQVFIF